MDALSYFPSESGSFDDEYYEYQTNFDTGYGNHAQSMPYAECLTQPNDQYYDESYVGSNSYPFDQTVYPPYSTMNGPPSSAANTESPVEEFQYIDFEQSFMSESQAPLNMSYSPVRVIERPNDVSPRDSQSSNTTPSSSAPKEKRHSKTSKTSKPIRPPHSRHQSFNATSSSHAVSPRGLRAAEPSSDVCAWPPRKRGLLDSHLHVFDSKTESSARRKMRAPFSDEGKKKVEAVRKIGACIECRGRKRPCGTSQPCQGCIVRAGPTMAATICIRESPFNDLSVTEFYGSAARTRVVDFNVDFTSVKGTRKIFTVDGKGRSSRPVHVIVLEVETSSLDADTRDQVTRVQQQTSRRAIENSNQESPKTVIILDPDNISALDLEKWAVEYSYKFTKAYNKNALAYLFAIEYVEKGLPHSSLVANMVKLISLNYVLFHDIKITPDTPDSDADLRTLRAQIDTKLFQCLYRAEKFVYQRLHKIIFLSSGRLTRDAGVPVCLVLWLLVRIQSLRASYFANLRPKNSTDPILSSRGKVTTSASHQYHALNLLACIFSALFRSSLPLLLNFDDSFNKDLVGNDEELLTLAKRVKGIMLWFRAFGYPKFHRQSMSHSMENTKKIRELIKN